MDVIFGLYKAFKKDNEDTKILFLTPTDPDFIKGEISKENIPHNDIRIHSSSYKDVYKYLMAGDFGLINYSKTYSTIGRSPTKLGEYWACGLPVISQSEIGDIDFLVNKYPNSGYLIDNLNMKSFDSAVDRLKAMSFSKTKLREYSIDYYDLKKGAESYQKIYKKILD